MKKIIDQYWLNLLVVLGFLIITGTWFVAEGPFLIDEVIYYMAADAFMRTGSLIVENGLKEIGSDAMGLGFLIPGPNGLAPQYPIGMATVGAPAVKLMGIKGLIFLNAIAAAGTLIVLRDLTWRLFGDPRVALAAPILLLCSTYWLEYAYGIWPHSISVFFVTLALTLTVRGLESSTRPLTVFLLALGSGFSIGAGFLFRTDTILILPAIGAVVVLFSPRPFLSVLGGTAGLLPAICVASLSNAFKFGTFNPLSYGVNSGGVALATYFPLMTAASFGFAALVLIRVLSARSRNRLVFLALSSALLAIILVPQAGREIMRLGTGFATLILDIRNIDDGAIGVQRFNHNTVQIFSMTKKALGQSLPWIGMFAVLAVVRWKAERRLAYTLAILAFVFWTAPFLLQSWHGGRGSNMRYFLPLLPMICAVGARLLFDIVDCARPRSRPLLYGSVAGVALFGLWNIFGPAKSIGAQQILTLWMLALAALTVLIFRLAPTSNLIASSSQTILAAALSLSTITNVADFVTSQYRRQMIASVGNALSDIQPPSVVFGYVPYLYYQVGRKDVFIAKAAPDTISAAIKRGYAAYLVESEIDRITEIEPRLAPTDERVQVPGGRVVRMKLHDPPR